MKTEKFIITGDSEAYAAAASILKVPTDGTVTVTISPTKGKSARQRGLQWIWYQDIARSGVGDGRFSNKDRVHLMCKFKFGVPIEIEDPETGKLFEEIWNEVLEKYRGREDVMMYFVDKYVSTEDFNVNQMAEYLTNISEYFNPLGVNLTDPDPSLLEWAQEMEAE